MNRGVCDMVIRLVCCCRCRSTTLTAVRHFLSESQSMNAQTTVALALALLMQNSTVAADDVSRESNAIFVQEGNVRSTHEIGDDFLAKAELVAASENLLAKSIQVGGLMLNPTSPPKPLVLRRSLGLVTVPVVNGRLVHEAKTNLFETRATITLRGDYLLMFPEGEHSGGKKGTVNKMIAYRSLARWLA